MTLEYVGFIGSGLYDRCLRVFDILFVGSQVEGKVEVD